MRQSMKTVRTRSLRGGFVGFVFEDAFGFFILLRDLTDDF
jgi:hypothetical protein